MSKDNDLLRCHILYEKNDPTVPTGAVVTPRGRAWFLAVDKKFKSRTDKKAGDGAYISTICVPPTADLTAIKAICKDAAISKFGSKIPGNLKTPMRLCKEVFNTVGAPKYPADMDNWIQITANTYSQQPGIVDRNQVRISNLRVGETTDDLADRLKEECYSGRWLRMSVSAKGYDVDNSKGVKLYLQNVQLLDHDDKVGGKGGGNAETDFGAVAGADGGALPAEASADSVFG